ncbi:MAG: pyrimidine dimer DNA glycosylase/endonuclease V [Actinomycetaceae bacterium]|nr:pyrimidine dimer DNA glycosylase/endonuclease V [Actinomycetaceae bacterium]
MRLWTLHPKYLDRQGLTACWREALLAQAVIAGRTKGYTQHPQLKRFKDCDEPLAAVGTYLNYVQQEATQRGYKFDATRIDIIDPRIVIPATDGQVAYERAHLLRKLAVRTPSLAPVLEADLTPELHPMFTSTKGPIADWERL